MLNQMPFTYPNMPNMNNQNLFVNYEAKINELEQRINNLEKELKKISQNNYSTNKYDYQTSMHMM